MQKIHFFSIIIFSLTVFFSCDDTDEPQEVLLEDPVYTAGIDFSGDGRIYYQKTGPTWDDPDVDVGETLVTTGNATVKDMFFIPEQNDMAAYCSDSTPLITIYPAWRDATPPPAASYRLIGTLSTPDGTETTFFDVSGDLTIDGTGYLPVEITAAPLPPSTGMLYNLRIKSVYTYGDSVSTRLLNMELAQVWRCPLPGTPLYKKIIEWGSSWINGYFEDAGENSPVENDIADILLMSMDYLVDLGYRYGPFPRPDDIDDRAEVFLDFKQSACGEFRGFFMALTETQGIDSNWLWFWFSSPSSTWYSMYETRVIAALGREEQVWRYADHVVTEVNGIVYDPTYLVIKENADAYEDFMFARFCYGEDRPCVHASDWCTLEGGPQGICIDNPPGYDPDLGMKRYRGEDYN